MLHDICSLARLGFVHCSIARHNLLFAEAVSSSLPVKREMVAQQVQTLTDLAHKLRALEEIPNLTSLVSMAAALEKKTDELRQAQRDIDDAWLLVDLANAAFLLTREGEFWLKCHVHPTSAKPKEEKDKEGRG